MGILQIHSASIITMLIGSRELHAHGTVVSKSKLERCVGLLMSRLLSRQTMAHGRLAGAGATNTLFSLRRHSAGGR